MFGKTKLKIAIVSVVAALFAFMVQPTAAYYQTVGKATNVVTSGNIQLIIHEKTDQGTEFPADGVYILPGDVVSKEVSIENDCAHPFYLRVRMIYGTTAQDLTPEECLKLNINSEYWQLHDGWSYYKDVVNPGETTPNVFSHVEIVGNKVQTNHIGKTLSLTVNAQAVQSENNPITNGNIYTASGWPKE